MENNEKFNYTYSAKEQEEIKEIRKKYATSEEPEDKMTQLRRLDASVTKKATTTALIFGVIGTLIMGMGMSLVMTDIGDFFGLNKSTAMLTGIITGLVGIFALCIAYPVYNRIIKKERKKIAPEIIRLTDELTEQKTM